ncbi:MAG: hypothetical protein ABS95_00435 [Verrucomicrobia bacterium SCN 57-15]|nr:MAG: hypothetical protein ABS95_00435 [Verrucomicrobia bacterium SCN 57-15]
MNSEPECYGKIFPDLSRTLFNQWLEGRAFKMLVESSGMGISGRTLSVKKEEWKQCVACPSYRECYDLSIATLLLHQAMQDFGLARAL